MKQYDAIIIGFGKAERRWLPSWQNGSWTLP